MREFARCLAWALAAGALALGVAVVMGLSLEHAEGPRAWLMLAGFMPLYALPHLLGSPPALPVQAAAELGWLLLLVAVGRWGFRQWMRARR